MEKNVITFKNLCVEIKEKKIISNISLEIENSNNIIVIAGESGSGKTTLLNIINNPNMPKHYKLSGSLDYHNCNIKMINHTPHFNPFLTVKETIQMFINSYELTNNVDYYLNKFNIHDICDKIIGDDENKSLSTGQLIELSILLNTMTLPDLLILDEPFSNLDVKSSLTVLKILKNLKIPIIITLHHPNNLMLKYVDWLYILNKGEIVLNTSLTEVGNKLEYYENAIFQFQPSDIKINILKKKEVFLKIINYKNKNLSAFKKKIYYSCYFFLTYFLKNKMYLKAIVGSYVPILITYILLSGTDFSSKINGYVILINLFFMYLTSLTGTTIITYFEFSKIKPIIEYYANINIVNELFVYLFLVVYNFIITSTYTILICSVNAYLNKNNNILLNDFLKIASYSKFIEIYSFVSVMYLTKELVSSMSIWITYSIFQILNSGVMSNIYPEIKFFSMYFYLLNLISTKAQEVYNYPLLANGEYIYAIYGYKSDVTNYYYYLIGFLIVPTLFFMHQRKDRLFLT